MRVFAAAMAAALAATMAWSSAEAVDVQIDGFPFVCKSPEGEFLKPKFGDVDGIYFTNLPAERKPCLETIDRMIYSCTANTTFVSHDLNNQYPDCLPIFERQAEQCVRHFEQERQKCYASDSSAPEQPAAEIVSSSSDDAGDMEIKGFSFGCTTPDGETRKPWYGGVDGTRFTDLPSEREACLSLLSHKISSCRKNISFADHRQNRKFAACLPIFKEQVQDCVRHFEQERQKCYAGDSSAPAAITVEPEEPEAEPAHLTMWAMKRSNIRGGPGTDHAKVGLLEIGDEVQVTGGVGDWLRIEAPGGGDAFVYAPLLTDDAPSRPSARAGTETAWALDIPDKATRDRVADWMDRCMALWRSGLMSHVSPHDSVVKQEKELLKIIEFGYRAAENAKQYLDECIAVSKRVRDSGRPCGEMGRKTQKMTGYRTRVLRDARYYLESDGQSDDAQQRTVEEYLQTCVTAYATVLDGRHLKPYRSEDDLAEPATTAPMDNGSVASIARTEDKSADAATTASGSSASVDSRKVSTEGEASPARIPVDATHCVKLHEVAETVPVWDGWEDYDGTIHTLYRFKVISRFYENTCAEPIVLRVRHFAKYKSRDRSFVYDLIYPGRYKSDNPEMGYVLEVNNTDVSDVELRRGSHYHPPSEIAYCAEFVDTDITPEYLYNERYRVRSDDGMTYSGVVDNLRGQGIKVGPEMRAYYDAYFDSLEHSPCYAEIVREPPIDYEHFPPLDMYEAAWRMSLYVTFHTQGGGFEALSFDEEADFGGVTFHDVGGHRHPLYFGPAQTFCRPKLAKCVRGLPVTAPTSPGTPATANGACRVVGDEGSSRGRFRLESLGAGGTGTREPRGLRLPLTASSGAALSVAPATTL